MATYQYKAMDPRGNIVRGTSDAASLTDLELHLAQLGLDLINFSEGERRLRPFATRRVPRHEIINFTFHLEQLVGAGVSIIDGLRDLRDSVTHAVLRDIVAELLTAIESGQRFSEALRTFPQIFGSVYISMIRVGEESGRLDAILKDLTEMLRWQDELVAQARHAVLYPVLVAVVVLPAMVVLMVLLVPQLTNLLELTGSETPWHTRALLATSDIFVAYWQWLLAAPFLIAAVGKGLAATSPAFCCWIDRLKLNLWVLGPILYKVKIARFANYFALLYASGITVLDSISLSRAVVGNAVLDAALAQAQGRIADGGGIGKSFAQCGLFPPLVVRMLKVGEHSGAMDKALLNVSYFYTRQVKEAVDGLATMLGPLLVLIIASLLGWIMISILPPIYAAMVSLDF